MNRLLPAIFFLFIAYSPWSTAQTYTVGVEDIDYYPLYAYRDGSYKGAARQILDKFAASKGYTFEYRPFPIVRLTNYFVEGKVDFKFPDNENWAADAKKSVNVTYSDPVLEYTDGVMVLPANKGKGVAALHKLGTVRGFTAWDYLSLIKQGKVITKEASSLQSLTKQGLHGRVDGVYFNVDVARYYLSQNKGQEGGLVFDEGLPHTSSSYKLSTHKHAKIIDEFNQFLADEAAWINEIKAKHNIDK